MKQLVFITIIFFTIIGCADKARVEIGFCDEGSFRGTKGNILIRVLKIELPEDTDYTTIWEGAKLLLVPIQNPEFISITENLVEITPGSYKKIRLTADSISYVQKPTNILLVDTVHQFVASAFSEIVIEEDDELKLVIDIASDNWFDSESLKVRTGHAAFEGAQLKVYYQYW